MAEDYRMADVQAARLRLLKQLSDRPDYEVGVMRVFTLPRPVRLWIRPTVQEANILLSPIRPTRRAPRGTVRPASRRLSRKPSTKPRALGIGPIPSGSAIDEQRGLWLLAWLRKWHIRLLGRPGSRRRERLFRRNRHRLHDEYPHLWGKWCALETAQRKTVLGA